MGNKETEREKNRDCTINQVQEPSGAAAYLENAGQKKEDWVDVPAYDPRIPGGDGHTEEEYFSLPDDLRVELIDGVFYAMASPSRLHQGTAIEITRQLADCIEEGHRDCFVYIAPSDVALGEDKKTVVQPDIYVHCNKDKDKVPGPYRAPPDLIVEILSPSNPENDLWRKRELYRRHGVREYWIINPAGLTVYVLCFKKTGPEEDTPVEYLFKEYSFRDKVPVQISDGRCAVDFQKVYYKIRHLL